MLHASNLSREDVVTASEIAEFVFCGEAWRLARTGHESANQQAREAGDRYHSRKAAAEKVAGGFVTLGRILIVLALLGMALLGWLAR